MSPGFQSDQDPLRGLFGGIVEQVFQVDLGICDTQVTDYIGGLLASFIHVEEINRLHLASADLIREVPRLEAEANLGVALTPSQRRRVINKYVGDYALFWTGVYPEQLRPKRQGGVDRLDSYLIQGRRSYGIASELSRPDDEPPGCVLRALAENFECCVHGLHLVRAAWERGGQLSGPG